MMDPLVSVIVLLFGVKITLSSGVSTVYFCYFCSDGPEAASIIVTPAYTDIFCKCKSASGLNSQSTIVE